MIVTSEFVFVHMHKTGGQTLNRIIASCFPDHRAIGYHYPRAAIPAEYQHLPVIGVVRNPWDWYVSWYSFNQRKGIRNPLFSVLSADGAHDFKATVTNLIELGADTPTSATHRAALQDILPATLEHNRGVGLTKSDIDDLAAAEHGYLTWLVSRMLGDEAEDHTHLAKFENLESSFIDIMDSLGVEQVDAVANAFKQEERRNVSNHSHYSHYYDDAMRELVRVRDNSVAERFGYSFEQVPGFDPPVHTEGETGFSKLLGRAENYLKLHDGMDVSRLAEKLNDVTAENGRNQGENAASTYIKTPKR